MSRSPKSPPLQGARLRLDAARGGVELRLHELETAVMEVVWGSSTPLAVGDVQRVLERERSIAYTTVMTTLVRLHEKGLLERERDGRRFLYRARLSRDELLRQTAREVLGTIDLGAGHQSLALLAESVSSADASELDQLEALIRARRKELDC
ncbi:MAG: BlaI/MecI/CopY family transcriptional regulator [Polyangiaceae bacterium]